MEKELLEKEGSFTFAVAEHSISLPSNLTLTFEVVSFLWTFSMTSCIHPKPSLSFLTAI